MSVVRHKVTNNLRCELDYNRKPEYLEKRSIIFLLKKSTCLLKSTAIFCHDFHANDENRLQSCLYRVEILVTP